MRRRACWIACSGVLLLACASASAEDELWLVRGGRATATIVRGEEDEFAADRLRRFLKDKTGAEVAVLPASDRPLPEGGCVVLVGSARSNRWVRELGNELGLDLDPAGLTDQGYVAQRLPREGRELLFLAGGGRDGTRHAVVDLLHWHLECTGGDVRLGPLDLRQIPRFRYRWFWTWDNRMDWVELTLQQPAKINRVVMFHQLNPGHYRSLDYEVSVRVDEDWRPVVTVRDNRQSGWVAHPFNTVLADAVRL